MMLNWDLLYREIWRDLEMSLKPILLRNVQFVFGEYVVEAWEVEWEHEA